MTFCEVASASPATRKTQRVQNSRRTAVAAHRPGAGTPPPPPRCRSARARGRRVIVSSPLSDYATSVCILVDNRAAAEGVHDAEDPIEAVQGAHSPASRLSKRLYTTRKEKVADISTQYFLRWRSGTPRRAPRPRGEGGNPTPPALRPASRPGTAVVSDEAWHVKKHAPWNGCNKLRPATLPPHSQPRSAFHLPRTRKSPFLRRARHRASRTPAADARPGRGRGGCSVSCSEMKSK